MVKSPKVAIIVSDGKTNVSVVASVSFEGVSCAAIPEIVIKEKISIEMSKAKNNVLFFILVIKNSFLDIC
jgi:hypothetical protein